MLDQAYFEYIEHPDYPDGIAEYLQAGHRVLVLRTFSKIYGLAGLGSATASAGGRDHRDREDAARVRREHAGPGRRAREPERRRGARRAAPPHPRGPAAARADAPRARPGAAGPPSRTSSSPRSGRTPDAALRGAPAAGRDRPAAGGVRRSGRSGSRSGRRTRTTSSPRSPPCSPRRAVLPSPLGYPGHRRGCSHARVFRMRTTLKRGIGRGAAVEGNGRAVLPPGALSPITVYRQPEPRSAPAGRPSAPCSAGCSSRCSWPPARPRAGLPLVPPERRRRGRVDAGREGRVQATSRSRASRRQRSWSATTSAPAS